jgi:hypothetical protein
VLLARLPAPLKFLPCCLCMQNIDNKDPSSLFAPLTRPRKSFALLAPRFMSEVGVEGHRLKPLQIQMRNARTGAQTLSVRCWEICPSHTSGGFWPFGPRISRDGRAK